MECYSTEQMIRFIKEYVNNQNITWTGILKRHAVTISRSTFMDKIYSTAENPQLIDDPLFSKFKAKSLTISKKYHPEGINRIITKFDSLKNKRNSYSKEGNDKTTNYTSLSELQIYYNYLLSQININELSDEDEENRLELEKRLNETKRQIELAKRYG